MKCSKKLGIHISVLLVALGLTGLFITSCTTPTQQSTSWWKTVNANFYHVARTADGNYVTTGNLSDKTYIYKFRENGTKIWDYHVDVDYSEGRYVLATSDKGALIVEREQAKPWVIKLDQNGNKQWKNAYELSQFSDMELKFAFETQGGYLLVGSASDDDGSFLLLILVNQIGEIIGSPILYQNQNDLSAGFPCAVALTNGGYLFVGKGNISGLLVVKYINNEFTIVYSNSEIVWTPLSTVLADDGSLIIVGLSYVLDKGFRATAIKLREQNNAWTIAWTYIDEDSSLSSSSFKSVCATTGGGVVAFGECQHVNDNKYGPLMVKLNSNGEEVWARKYPYYAENPDSVYSIVRASDGGFVASVKPPLIENSLLMKVDSEGNVDWNNQIPSNQ